MAGTPTDGSNGHAAGGETVPPASEHVHLPGPTYLPVLVALGVTLVLVGVVINMVVLATGVILTLVCIIRWVRETREDMASLPLEH